jgi:hypothetical protein
LELYRGDAWLDKLWKNWQIHLDHSAAEGLVIAQIDIEPDPNVEVGQGPVWRLWRPRVSMEPALDLSSDGPGRFL